MPTATLAPSSTSGVRQSPNCPACLLRPDLCYCAHVPRLALTTRVTVLAHHRELKRSSNTGRIAHRALENSRMVLHGRPGTQITAEDLGLGEGTDLVLFPAPGAKVLDHELVRALPRPVHLIVPDGNWGQTSRLVRRIPALASVPRVILGLPTPAGRRPRRENREGRMSTLEAIAHALGYLEGDEVRWILCDLFRRAADGMLCQRGHLKRHQVYGLNG